MSDKSASDANKPVTLEDLKKEITSIKEEMATKSDIAEIKRDLEFLERRHALLETTFNAMMVDRSPLRKIPGMVNMYERSLPGGGTAVYHKSHVPERFRRFIK